MRMVRLCGGDKHGCLFCHLFLVPFYTAAAPGQHWGIGGGGISAPYVRGTGNSYIAKRLSAVVIPFCYLSNRTNLKENKTIN